MTNFQLPASLAAMIDDWEGNNEQTIYSIACRHLTIGHSLFPGRCVWSMPLSFHTET